MPLGPTSPRPRLYSLASTAPRHKRRSDSFSTRFRRFQGGARQIWCYTSGAVQGIPPAGAQRPKSDSDEVAESQAAGDGAVAMFGSQLRQFRVRSGLSQEALAEVADVSKATIAALEQGLRSRPHPRTVAALADALNLGSVDRLGLLGLAGAAQARRGATGPSTSAPDAMLAIGRVRIPVSPSPLIGRTHEVAQASALLDPARSQVRLLTLQGPGGVGKTRLALAVAAGLATSYADGVVFVDLAPLRDHRLVPATISWTLGLREAGGRSARDLLLAHLAERHVLLVVDNFEHLLGASTLLAELLAGCARLALLVTSRAVLNLRGEHRFEVAPLAPPAADVQSAEEVALSPAVQLFLERASAVAPDFALDATNAAAVAGVCRRLDGMPLALELAAARIPMLSPAGLLRRLERRLDLLTGGASDLPERQRTLRDTLAWSYELLDEAERTLFRRLSVFVGGWTLESAEMVCSGEHLPAVDVLNVLGSLTDKSLVQRLGGPIAEPRFGMLESVREYGLEQLEACGETAAARRRHLDWCLALAERLAPERFDPAQAAILKHEQDNLRAALDWAREHREVALGLRMAGALAGFWWVNGYPREGSAWLDPLLALAEGAEVPTAVRAKALHGAAVLANAQGEYARSKAQLTQSVALFRESGDVLGTARAIASLGGTAYDEGDLDGALGLWTESLALARDAGDPGEVAESLGCLGEAAYHLGDLEGAARCLVEASAIARQAGRTDIEAWELGGLANVARRQGDLASATALQRRALTMQTTLGDRRQIAISLQHLAQLHASAGRGEPAARLLGAATSLRELIGAPQPAPEWADTEQTVAAVRLALSEPLWATAFQAGRSLSLEQAIAEGLDEVV